MFTSKKNCIDPIKFRFCLIYYFIIIILFEKNYKESLKIDKKQKYLTKCDSK